MTDRGVSTALGYILLVAIAGVLLVGLTTSMTGLVDTQDERSTVAELDVYGERLAADIATADRLVQQSADPAIDGAPQPSVTVTTDLPTSVNDHRYEIRTEAIDGENATRITLVPDSVDRTVETVVKTTTPVADEPKRGGPLTIQYDPDTDQLVIENA